MIWVKHGVGVYTTGSWQKDPSIADQFIINDIEITDKGIIANKFNEFLTEIGPNSEAKIPDTDTSFMAYLNNPSSTSMASELSHPEEIIAVANELRNTQS